MRTSAILVVAAVLASCGGSSAPAAALWRVPLGDSPQRGPGDAWVTIVEFSDFQCPFCGRAEPTMKELLALYPADVRLVYKHYPLPPSIHPNARAAANAAECARAQQPPAPDGYFWQLHDVLFEHQSALDASSLATYAGQIAGLDVSAWQACFDARTYDARVQADLDLGTRLDLQGTPTFVINGEPLVGAEPLDTFKTKVEAARQAAIASGIPRDRYYDVAVLGL